MRLALVAFASLLVLAGGCEALVEKVAVQMELPHDSSDEWLDTPWPSDLSRKGDGTLDLTAFPNPYESDMLEEYLGLFQTARGYSSSGGLYFRVAGGVDAGSLPSTPEASLAPDASMFLVELARPDRRIPLEHRVYETASSYLPAGTVAVLPLLGAVVDEPAALVVTSKARHSSGAPLGPSETMRALMSCETVEVPCAPYRDLVLALGLRPDDVALVQLFTPQDAARELSAAFDVVLERGPPAVRDLARVPDEQHEQYDVYRIVVELAKFQAGTPPYHSFDGVGGGFVVGEDGRPAVQGTEDVVAILTVPRAAPPDDGWPVVVYGHGTGGSSTSALGDGPSAEAHQLARAGYAMLATSEPLHEGRAGFQAGGEELDTFNFLNPLAGRDNWRQSALEKAQLVSAVEAIAIPASVSGFKTIHLDETRVAYFGHSQGGIVGALLVGVEHRILGAFLSGAGGGFAPSLIEKTEPVELVTVLSTLLNLPDDEQIDRFHPVPSLLQIWIEPSEPLNYGRLWRERTDRPTPHLVASSGLVDPYTPKRNHAGLAGAFGLPVIEPVAERLDVVELLGIGADEGPAEGNLSDGRGEPLTGGLLQYPDDGHFAVFYNPDAQEAYRLFFETLLGGVPVAQVRP